MSEAPAQHLVLALGRLLTDPQARAAWQADRSGWCQEAGVPEGERATLLALDPAELEVQANLLLNKRLGEVSGHLKLTFEALGSDTRELFLEYALSEWPRGHLRHVHDALGFLRWLRERRPRAVSGMDQAFTAAHLRWREGRGRVHLEVGHYADDGPFSGLSLVWTHSRGKWRSFFPLPWLASWGRRSWS